MLEPCGYLQYVQDIATDGGEYVNAEAYAKLVCEENTDYDFEQVYRQVRECISSNTILNENTPDGLGDTIHNIAVRIGADVVAQKVAEFFGAEDCGCERRRVKLNEMFPYKKGKNV